MFAVYLILFFIAVTTCVYFAYYGSLEMNKKSIVNARLALFVSFLIAFTFLGFRYNVGRDFINYMGDYKYIDSSDFGETFSYYKFEYGYYILLLIARFFNTGPQGIFIFTSFILLILYFNLFKNRWNLLPVSFFVFFVGTPYVFSINGLRQAIAILAFLNALNCLNSGSQIKRTFLFLLWMVLGVLFHTSALFFLPCVLFKYEKVIGVFNSKMLFLIAFAGFILNVLGLSAELLPNQELLGTEGYSYGTAFDSDRFDVNESVLSLGNVFHLILILIPLSLYDKIKDVCPDMRVYFVSLAFGSTIFFLFSNNMFTQRISYYFLFSEIIVYPVISLFARKRGLKINWWTVCAVMYFMLFYVALPVFLDNQLYPNASVWGISLN